MTDPIPDHVGREAVRLLNKERNLGYFNWPEDADMKTVITVAKLLMNPPAPMTDPDEEAAKRVMLAWMPDDVTLSFDFYATHLTRATVQMRKEREAWEAGR